MWISVEEKLPESNTWVLCYSPAGEFTSRSEPHYDVLRWKGDYWDDVYGHCLSKETVTHWMTLPELPKLREQCTPKYLGWDEVYCRWYECSVCGEQYISYGSKYCSECGAEIVWGEKDDSD